MERIDAPTRKHPEHEQLERRDHDQGDADPDRRARQPAARNRDRAEQQAEKQERERAAAERQRREHDREPHAPHLKGAHCPEHEHEPERVAVQPGEERRRSADREDPGRPQRRLAPLLPRDRGEQERRDDRSPEHERRVTHQGCGQVVDEAVVRNRILARVPEVVPENRAVLDEQRAVKVHRGITGSRAQGEEEHADEPGHPGADHALSPESGLDWQTGGASVERARPPAEHTRTIAGRDEEPMSPRGSRDAAAGRSGFGGPLDRA